MRTLDEIYQIVEESSHETAFNRGECEAMYDLAIKLNKDDCIVELGVQFGRSTTVLAEVQKEIGYHFMAIDNWQEEYSNSAKPHVFEQATKHDWRVDFVVGDSKEEGNKYKGPNISLIHVDADHSYEAVLADCQAWLSKVKVGGHVLFDDYGHDSLPGVFQAVSEYMEANKEDWEFVGRYGNKLGIFKRIK